MLVKGIAELVPGKRSVQARSHAFENASSSDDMQPKTYYVIEGRTPSETVVRVAIDAHPDSATGVRVDAMVRMNHITPRGRTCYRDVCRVCDMIDGFELRPAVVLGPGDELAVEVPGIFDGRLDVDIVTRGPMKPVPAPTTQEAKK